MPEVAFGGGGTFPHVNALINWEHPLAANLIFFAVPTPYGWFDLVRHFPMPHITPTGSPLDPSDLQLFTQTPLGIPAWCYGNGNTNPRGAYAVTPILSSYQPVTALSLAASFWSYPFLGGYAGTTSRLVSATSGTDNTGVLSAFVVNGVSALLGGGGSTTSIGPLTNVNNIHTTHGTIAAYNTVDLFCQLDNGNNNAVAVSKAWSGINQIRIGDPSNASGRPIFWVAAWSTYLASGGSSIPLGLLVTSPDGAVNRNPNFGAIPRGLLLSRRRLTPAPI